MLADPSAASSKPGCPNAWPPFQGASGRGAADPPVPADMRRLPAEHRGPLLPEGHRPVLARGLPELRPVRVPAGRGGAAPLLQAGPEAVPPRLPQVPRAPGPCSKGGPQKPGAGSVSPAPVPAGGGPAAVLGPGCPVQRRSWRLFLFEKRVLRDASVHGKILIF